MAELTYLARPYARAAYEYAQAMQQVQEWAEQLKFLGQLVAAPEAQKALLNPNMSDDQKALFCIALSDEKKLTPEFTNFIKTLAENKRLLTLPAIADLFAELRAAEEQEIKVQVSTVCQLDNAAQQKLIEALQKKLKCNVKLECKIDPQLIGGLFIRANDLVIDASIRGDLQRLREELIN